MIGNGEIPEIVSEGREPFFIEAISAELVVFWIHDERDFLLGIGLVSLILDFCLGGLDPGLVETFENL